MASVATAGTLVSLNDTNIVQPTHGEFMMYDGLHWVNTVSSGTVGWGAILGDIADQTDLNNTFVHKTGDSLDGTFWLKGFLNLKNSNQTNSLCWHSGSTSDRYAWGLNSDINNKGFQYDSNLRALMPLVDQGEKLGSASFRWARIYALYLDSSANGTKPITIPNKSGTMALMSDVELAANSGSQLYSTGCKNRQTSRYKNECVRQIVQDVRVLLPEYFCRHLCQLHKGLDI